MSAIFNVNNGGKAAFSANSTGGMAIFNINPGGTLGLSGHSAIPQRGDAQNVSLSDAQLWER